jgi:hypothetical protein
MKNEERSHEATKPFSHLATSHEAIYYEAIDRTHELRSYEEPKLLSHDEINEATRPRSHDPRNT